MEDFTEDSLFAGALRCLQARHGYRFSVDAVLLAHFVKPGRDQRVLDLGAGCGVISLILAFRRPDLLITALELQPQLAQLIHKNIELNGFTEKIRPIEGDLRQIAELLPAGSYDWVVTNPPYRRLSSGRKNVADEQALARHELTAGIAEVARAAAFALRTGGRAAFVYPASRLAPLFLALAENRLAPKRLRLVHGYPGAPARLVLLEAVKNGGEELLALPPLFLYQERGGDCTEELAAMYMPCDRL